jgi:uncharacterized protein involved in exopolysaccharide biosynthesis
MTLENNTATQSSNEPRQTIFVQLPATDDGDDIDLVRVATALRRAAKVILIAVTLITVIALGLSFLVTPVYRGEAVVAPIDFGNTQSGLGNLAGSFGGIAALAGVDLGADSTGKEALAILRSRAFARQFLMDFNLMPVLFEELWDADRSDWISANEQPTLNEAVLYFQEDVLQVSEEPDANLILIRIHWHDRTLAALWANEIVAAINSHIRSNKILEAKESIAFLEQEQAASSIVEVKQGIYSLIQQQIESIMLANVKEEYAFKVIDPAVVPDADDYIKPSRLLWVVGAFFSSLLLSFGYIIFREVFAGESNFGDSENAQ